VPSQSSSDVIKATFKDPQENSWNPTNNRLSSQVNKWKQEAILQLREASHLRPSTFVTTLKLWAISSFAMPTPISPIDKIPTVAICDILKVRVWRTWSMKFEENVMEEMKSRYSYAIRAKAKPRDSPTSGLPLLASAPCLLRNQVMGKGTFELSEDFADLPIPYRGTCLRCLAFTGSLLCG
jgi:hypothetical protein